jgi:hypothetical protein
MKALIGLDGLHSALTADTAYQYRNHGERLAK